MPLREYKRKRDFHQTAEPAGKAKAAARATGSHVFVVQKHDASHLHYDFRLELGGVLLSWAVPKGPSNDPHDRRLAVQVEDHPIEYGKFEGTIPKGQYGGGTVMLWDRGTWQPKKGTNPAQALRDGKLEFELFGTRLIGKWILIRLAKRSGQKPQWLLRKIGGESAKVNGGEDRSVASDRTMDQIANGKSKVWSSAKRSSASATSNTAPALSGAKKAAMPRLLKPELATLSEEVPEGDEWIHEAKFDGYRVLAYLKDGHARLMTRNGLDWSRRFGPIAPAVESLDASSAILDGEVVMLDATGRTNFQRLQAALKESPADLVYFIFDLPYLDGQSLVGCSLADRRDALKKLVASLRDSSHLRFSDAIEGHGRDVQKHACKLGLEGVLCKRRESRYISSRTRDWIKVKCVNRQEMIVIGFTEPKSSRESFGSLLLGYNDKGALRYGGKVGTGFDRATLKDVLGRLKRIRTDTPQVTGSVPGISATTWVEPKLVAEIKFTEWTRDGLMRHPSFVELRDDKKASEVVRERPAETSASNENPSPQKHKPAAACEATIYGVTVTHPDRVLFPEIGLTKLDVARYYAAVADQMMPHVIGRPLSVLRCPQGVQGQSFYQRNWPREAVPGAHIVPIRISSSTISCLVPDDPASLIWLVQHGVIEMHTWGCTEKDLDHPDRLVFDLDPAPEVVWGRVVEGARRLRAKLAKHGITTVVKATGGKGLHVLAAIAPRWTWDQVKTYSRGIAEEMVAEFPSEYVATMSKQRRTGAIFIDYLRNNRGATFVAPYSLRARPEAPCSFPLSWRDLASGKPHLSARNATEYFASHRHPWAMLAPQSLPGPSKAPWVVMPNGS